MALATGPINHDACMPTPATMSEVVFGYSSTAVAMARAVRRQAFLQRICNGTYWLGVVEESFPNLLAKLTDAADDEEIVTITQLRRQDVELAAAAINRASTLKIVYVPTPDD